MRNKMKSFGARGASFAAVAAKFRAHQLRCKSLPPMQPGEAERLMAEFLCGFRRSPLPGRQGRHCLPHALRGTDRAAGASRAKRTLTMAAYLTATGIALGLLAGWAALVPFVA